MHPIHSASSPLPASRNTAATSVTSRPSPDWWLFFTKFLQQGKAIASVAPSSRWLARAVLQGIDFGRTQCVVELGAGTGPITAELLCRARRDSRIVVVERDADFCRRLRFRFPQADIAQADAGDLESLFQERSLTLADHVISGLPLPSFPRHERNHVLGAVARHLRREGTFRQLTHLPWVYYRLYREYFTEVEFRFVPCNLPPSGYYVCRGWRGG
jgi:phospholipid N-methyltransferase